MLSFTVKKHLLQFKIPAGTSRGTLYNKPSWFIILKDILFPEKVGLGECNIIPFLSIDDISKIDKQLDHLSKEFKSKEDILMFIQSDTKWPAIRFGLETALKDLENGSKRQLFPSKFTEGVNPISINGLIWMGDKKSMFQQLKTKLDDGWNCIKLKIGAIDFDEEIELLSYIRKHFDDKEVTLRVDANGAFSPKNALDKLAKLAKLNIHSIEQPIAAKQIDIMASLCESSPIPIALDEELIGVNSYEEKKTLLERISPQYIILKPGLIGGFQSADEWISIAKSLSIKYWSTSALESNIGLNAISQWAAQLDLTIPQGLGTGTLYTNNITSPLEVEKGYLWYKNETTWDLSLFQNED